VPPRLNPTVFVAAPWRGLTPAQRSQVAAVQPAGHPRGRRPWSWDELVVAAVGLAGALFCVESIAAAPRWEPGAFGFVANVLVVLAYLRGWR
jgi:hypothetical protein